MQIMKTIAELWVLSKTFGKGFSLLNLYFTWDFLRAAFILSNIKFTWYTKLPKIVNSLRKVEQSS